MKNKYTIIFIPPDHSNTHQFQFSKLGKQILGGGMLLIGVIMIGLFAQNLYLNHYIKERQPTLNHIDQLETTLVERDQEIIHLNEMSNQITDDLQTIKQLEEKLSSLLKINPTSSSATVSRGIDPAVQSFGSSKPAIQTLDHQATIVTEHLNLLQRYYEVAVLQKDKLDHTPTILPAEGEITSSFGYRRNPFGGRSTEYHNGIDIACNYGTPVLASAAGVVTFAARDPVYGHKVVIDHGHGIETFYGHNSRLLVKKGDQVKKADLIAYSGNSGRSTGSHLHYGAIVNGLNVDPLTFTNFI
ncbi:M23 family metallopeptidase [Desulfosporosinus sp. BICA1-9]|uniref:M23 family metallopeptidase n=1 Tax=Desulfosporosinus sp. BICA1-9 TaxID=1531958 RepID=UPI00054B1E51|nr:M23 family metallopeptidase [Desulfosporosinus sp. BICA1-9]KJS49418.1 MAG: metalloendopeptidase [Peptococcaceae bacterium BRH_c23]KJS80001.1 MAG: metalloendopeptidase [Desulfosporosinus sp. BICA1-9]HBW36838.1 metalloendopeptidase [Desulfosporosinus sp.]